MKEQYYQITYIEGSVENVKNYRSPNGYALSKALNEVLSFARAEVRFKDIVEVTETKRSKNSVHFG